MSLIKAYIDDFGMVNVTVPRRFFNGETSGFYLLDEEKTIGQCMVRRKEDHDQKVIYQLTIPADLPFGKKYFLREDHGQIVPLQFRYIVHNPVFSELFSYDGNDLGNRYHPEYTKFALWAPTAVSVVLKLFWHDSVTLYEMNRTEKGVYRIQVDGDLKDATYVYLVERNGEIVETTDPYSLSSTANSLRSAVIDVSVITSIQDNAPLRPLESNCDAIIYECSIRDMTSLENSGTMTHGKYVSLCETETKYNGQETGLDYLVSLGITHVQFQPVLDFATVDELNEFKGYNWGYDPSQLVSLEGSYSIDPSDPYCRMIEFKKLVCKLHSYGIRVNLDVVFNHMYDSTNNPLEACVPYYYFRYNNSGYLSNGSYCGNDLESRQPMMRHLYLFALRSLMEIYNVDGFRFDLMGILDVDTMNIFKRETSAIKKDVMLYGEGWDMPTALPDEDKAKIYNQFKMHGIGHFNDTFRDVLKGASSDDQKYEKGYLTGKTSEAFAACGALCGNAKNEPFFRRFDSPDQSINAIETHDNATIWDKMHACCEDEPREIRQSRQRMMLACTLFAQGVPFLHAGSEFCGTKKDNSNSYNAKDDINGMNYERKNINSEIVEYTKRCIKFRKEHALLRLRTRDEINEKVSFVINDDGTLFYDIHNDHEMLRIMINPTREYHQHHFNEGWKIVFDQNGYEQEGHYQSFDLPLCSIVIVQKSF